MNQKAVFTKLVLSVGVMAIAVVISLALRAQPVQTTSHSSTGSIVQGWRQVNVDGFGDANNQEALRLAIHNEHLFVSTVNPATGGEVWRSSNGTEWNQVNIDGFGVISNTMAFVESSFGSYLYAGTTNNDTGAEVWRCAVCDGTDWARVVSNGFGDVNNRTVQRVMVFSDTLYATVDNGITGVEVWKSTTGNINSWVQSNVDGFGNSQNTGAWATTIYNGSIYVATAIAGDWTPPDLFGVEVWRTEGNNNWVKVTPVGFGGTENVGWDLATGGGKLYLATGNFSGAQIWRCVICDGSDWDHVVNSDFGSNAFAVVLVEYQHQMIAATTNNWTIGQGGIDIWKSEDGVNWAQISSQGFGDTANAKIGSGALAIYRDTLYLGTQNNATGAELWQMLNQVYLPIVIR